MCGKPSRWRLFNKYDQPPKGDYWCEVPALKLRSGGCLCRALYWTGERWEGPGGEYEVGRYVPEMLEQLHGHWVVCEIDEGRDQWRLDAAIARIRELENERDRATKLFELVSAERNELVRRANKLESESESMAIRIERLSAELAKPENVRLREVTEAMAGRSVMFDDIAERVRQELHELGRWIERAGKAERELSEIRRMHSEPHDALCRDHMHTRTRDEHNCSKDAIAALRRQTSTQEDSHNEQVGMVGTMRGLPK